MMARLSRWHRWAGLVALSVVSVSAGAQAPQRTPVAFSASPLVGALHRARASSTPSYQPTALLPAAPASCQRTGGDRFRQFAVGIVGAWAVGLVAFKTLDDPHGPGRKVKGDAGYTPNANTAYALGSWLGSAGGAYLAGRNRSCGSFKKTLLLTGIPSVPLLLLRDEPYLPVIGVILGAPAQSLVSTLAYPK